MPRPRFKKLEEKKKQLILDVASHEFAEHGFEKASYNAIIEKCGLSKGVMYYYFDDKRDLFNTILADANQSYLECMGEWKSCKTKDQFWNQVKLSFDKTMEFFSQDPRAARLVTMSMNSPDVLTETYKQLEESSSNWFVEVLSEGQDIKAVRSDIPMDYLIHLVFAIGKASDQWMLSRWEDADESSIAKDINIAFDVFKSFLSPTQS